MNTVLIWIVMQMGMSSSGSATFGSVEACEQNRVLIIDAMLKKGVKAQSIYINCTPAN